MTNRRYVRWPIGVLIAGTLAACFLIPEWPRRWPIPLHAAQPASSAATAGGPTATRLPDGRWLLVGGTGSEARAMLWDPSSGTATPTGGSLHVPRAEHSATMLSDGTVLIAGGRQGGGALVESPELFDPATGTFTLLPIVGAVPRASHTATLLTDGRVLVAGGSNGGPTPLDVELWDVSGQTATALPDVAVNRSGHQATLLSDGRVLMTGGDAVDGPPPRGAIVVDPVARTVRAINPPAEPRRPPVVVDTLPPPGATDVPLDAHLALRFSDALIPASVTPASVTLRGPGAAVETRIVVAEGGRLAFVWPAEPLNEDTTYALTIDGPIDPFGVPVIPTSMAFTTTTRATRPDSAGGDTEAWVPSADASDGWRTGRPPSSWTALPPLAAPLGVTAIAGQVLTLDGRPLRNVTFSLEGDSASTRSDGTGRFLLVPHTAPSGHGVLHIDGATASHPNRTYGFFEWGFEWNYELKAGQTSVLRFPIWMPKLDTDHTVQIPSPTASETVITTPTMPGFELHLPAGTVIRDHNGKVAHAISLTPIPLDRPPFPLPGDATFTMDYTIQPGGAYVSTPGGSGAWVVYPARASSGPVGKRVQFVAYDPDDAGWTVYGMGTVGATQVRPDARTRIYAFTKASFNDGNTPAAGGSGPDPKKRKGDPVDPSTGAFIMHKTDLFLPDVIPIAVTRTYNSLDTYARPFGTGMMHAYTIFQHSEHQFDEADLIQTDGAKIHYVRISADGLPWYSTVLESQAAPNGFYKSRISFNFTDNGWTLARTDGTVYIFGHEAPLQKIRDRYGNEVRVSWSGTNTFGAGVGNITRVTSPNGRYIDFTYYTGTSRVYQAKDNTGRTVTYTYDTNGNLLTVTDPLSQVTTYSYDASNRMLTIRDGRNIVYLTNTYTSGRVTTQTLAESGQTYQFVYTVDGSNNITQTDVTDPRGTVGRVSFNSSHFATTEVEALGTAVARTTTYERQSGSNLLTAVTDGLSRRTEFTYDNAGHVLTTTRLAGTVNAGTTTYTYESLFGQVASVTDPLSHTWTLSYDALGRLTGITDPLSHQTTVQFNGSGQVTSVTDPLIHTWQWEYTGGDLTSTADPSGNTTRRFVDAAGRTLSMTDPLGHVTLTTFDALDRATTITDALGGQTVFTYDANNNLLSLTDALTHATSYTYDNRDRVATRTDPLTHQASYTYDATSNLTQTIDRKSQVTSRTYDALSRPTLLTFADTSTIAYTYDAGDRITQIADSANGTITRTYDDLDRLTSETTPQGTVSYTYDADGRRATMTVAGQTAMSYGYDNAHRLTSITQGTAVVAFTYDEANRRSTLTYPNGIVATYGYDNTNQLTSLTYTSGQTTLGDLTYTYDAESRRTAVGGSWARTGIPTAVTSATYDAANRITGWAGTTFSYDPNGNLTSDGLTSYTWNARNQLSGMSGGTSASFAYDALERRRSKTVGGATTNFLYDGENLVQELTSGGTPTANLLTGLSIDQMFTRAEAGGTSTMLIDVLGSAVALADTSGAVQTQYTFDPFGTTTLSGATSSNSLQFTGRENDGTGLYYYRARYHAPALGRFTSEDPIGFRGGINLHTYADDSPTNLVDPSGAEALPLPRPGPLVIPPWVGWAWFDAWILQHDWNEFQKLCLASGWGWCSPSPSSSSSPIPSSDPLPDEKCEKQRCKQVRQYCIHDRCGDTLPTWDHGKSFFKCLDRCLKEFNCPGLP
jgi:RHS repeat-associated protein